MYSPGEEGATREQLKSSIEQLKSIEQLRLFPGSSTGRRSAGLAGKGSTDHL